MKHQIAFLLKSICCCSHSTRPSCCHPEDKTKAVQPCNLSKRSKRKKGRRSPYIETSPKNEKVLTFFMKALSKSTITGVNRLASTKNTFRKTLWCFVSLFCLGGFLYQALRFAVVYNSSPTDVVLRVENYGTLEFPSVTVCNNNRFRRSEYCKLYSEKCEPNNTSIGFWEKEFLKVHLEALKKKNHGLRFQLGHTKSIIKGCTFKGTESLNISECLNNFDLYFDPDFGNCYSFLARGKNGDVLAASEADFWQDENGLTLLLDVELEEFNEKRREPGLVLTVHAADILPDIHTDGIQVDPGFNYNFAVQESITRLLPFPYKTNCTDFSTLPWVSEDSLPSSRMCTVRCSQYFQLSNCGFVTEKLSMFYSVLPWEPDKITEEQLACARKMERKTKGYCKSLCGLPCEDILFEVAVDTRHLTNEAVLSFNRGLEMREILRNRRDNLAMVRIYYKNIERKIYEHVPKYNNQELFSYLGGYSGVWLGFSLLNMYELLEIVVATIKFALTKHREQTASVYKLLETITYHAEESFYPTLCVSIAMKHCVCKTYPLDYDPRKTLEIRITERECDVPNCPNNYKQQQNLDDPDWSMYATPHKNRRSPRSRQLDQSVFQYIVKALSDSSISGVNKLFSSKTLLRKTLWLIVLTSCLSGFAYQTYQFSKMYRKKPSVVQIEVENDGLAEFPAVTVCNTNRFRKSEFCKYKEEVCDASRDNLSISEPEIGEVVFKLLSEKNVEMKKQLGHSADMIQSCIFNGIPQVREEECARILQYSYDPDYGNCWTVPPRNSKGHVLEAREADFWQEANDLSLLIDLESDELLEKRRRPGIIVTVHDDSTAPDIHTDGHLIGPGRTYTLTIQKTSIILLPLPYKTNCTDYFSLPWQKNFKRRLTSRLCTVGCSQYYQNLKCKFITQNLSLFYEELPYDPEKSTEEDRKCAEEEEKQTQDYCRSICGLPCRDTIFVVTSSSTQLTEKEMYEHHIHSWTNRSWEDKMRNLALLKIYFSTLEHTIYRHIPKYDTMEFFSYLGGYSGVWLGFSLLTVYELIEILFCTARFALQKHQRAVQHRKVFSRMTNTKKASKHFMRKRRLYR